MLSTLGYIHVLETKTLYSLANLQLRSSCSPRKCFRRFFATKDYTTYLNPIKTAKALGHRNINNTLRYIADQEEQFQSSNYDIRVAVSEEEIKKAGEDGYEHYDTEGERHFYRKRKL